MSKERPMLFFGAMVRAIRIVKPQPVLVNGSEAEPRDWPGDDLWTWERHPHANGRYNGVSMSTGALNRFISEACPFGQVGDRLWVRETGYRPPYRVASRITLEITGIRVERLQDLSEADAQALGVERLELSSRSIVICGVECQVHPMTSSYTAALRNLWESIYGSESWDANLWVWVVEFERVTS